MLKDLVWFGLIFLLYEAMFQIVFKNNSCSEDDLQVHGASFYRKKQLVV